MAPAELTAAVVQPAAQPLAMAGLTLPQAEAAAHDGTIPVPADAGSGKTQPPIVKPGWMRISQSVCTSTFQDGSSQEASEDRAMELVIPDGAQVHIMVGQPPLLALPHDSRATVPSSERQWGRVTKGILAGVLLVGAFQAGRLLPQHPDTASAAPPAAAIAPGATEGRAVGEVPPAFRAQMAQPPQVVPPPGVGPVAPPGPLGTGPAAAAPPNPFGLHG